MRGLSKDQRREALLGKAANPLAADAADWLSKTIHTHGNGVAELPLRELWARGAAEGEAEAAALREAFAPAPQQLLRRELARIHRQGELCAARDVSRANAAKGKRKQGDGGGGGAGRQPAGG